MGQKLVREILCAGNLQLLSEDKSIHFIWKRGSARDLMDGVADVVVADSFTGNAVLKTMEGTAFGILKRLETSDCLETGRRNWEHFCLGPFEEQTHLDFSRCWGAVLFD